MQYLNTRKAIGLILALAFFIGGTHTALAVGTASGLTISNTATVDYDVAGDARSATGSDGGFLVDNRVDLTVTNLDAGNNVNVTPSATNRVQTYTVTNTGNTTQGYLLTTDVPTANIPMGSIEIWLDTNGNGIWDGAPNDTLYTADTNAFDLNPNGVIGTDDVRTVFVVADTPAAAVDGNQDDFRLVATTTAAGGVGLPAVALGASGGPSALVDVVFADGQGTNSELATPDGKHSDAATYTVTSALLTATKTIPNVSDEFNATGGFSIPGAVVRYLITTTAGGTGTVDDDTIVVSDAVPANTRLCVAAGTRCVAADLPAFVIGVSGLTSATLQYSDDNGATWTYTPTAPTIDAEGADSNITNVRYTTIGTMTNGTSATVTIGVVIN